MTTDAANPQTSEISTAPKRRWMKWLLTGSLAVNALFIGSFLGAVWRHGGHPGGTTSVPANILNYAERLPSARGAEPSARFKEYRRSIMPLRRSLQDARRDIVAVIAADPFDKARFVEAQKRLAEIEVQFRAQQQGLLADVAASLTLDERRGYARWAESRRARLMRGRGGADEDGDAPPRK